MKATQGKVSEGGEGVNLREVRGGNFREKGGGWWEGRRVVGGGAGKRQTQG